MLKNVKLSCPYFPVHIVTERMYTRYVYFMDKLSVVHYLQHKYDLGFLFVKQLIFLGV